LSITARRDKPTTPSGGLCVVTCLSIQGRTEQPWKPILILGLGFQDVEIANLKQQLSILKATNIFLYNALKQQQTVVTALEATAPHVHNSMHDALVDITGDFLQQQQRLIKEAQNAQPVQPKFDWMALLIRSSSDLIGNSCCISEACDHLRLSCSLWLWALL
jgi:hypothetical protein